jgi:pimeloyl-ACP methyl ester carboxylesterase
MARVTWEAPVDWTLPRWLRRLTMPTLIVWGEEDRIMPPAQAPSWAGAIAGARVRTFPAAGHLVLDEAPAAVAAIGEFMAEGP